MAKRWMATGVLMGLLGCGVALAADGEQDAAFGTDGQLTITRVGGDGSVTGMEPTGDLVVLPDGRFLWAAPLKDGSLWIGRALRDGAADAGFGDDGSGRVRLHACTDTREARLVTEADGGVVAWTGACLVKLRGDGSLDAAFGAGPQPPAGLRAAGLARDGEGRFLLAGTSGSRWLVYRFLADGTLDSAFGLAGEVEVTVPATNNLRELHAMVLRAEGRIVLGGLRGNTHGPNLVVAQLLADGTPDPAWDGDGLVDMEAPDGYQTLSANALVLDRDGSLVVGGMGSDGGVSCCILLARLDTAGQLVPGFGLRLFRLDGSPPLGGFFEQRDSVFIQPDGRIVVATAAFPFIPPFENRTQYALVRTLSDGSVDTGFGTAGWTSYGIHDPSGSGQTGDYNQLHATAWHGGGLLMLGRTFFEDNSNGEDYVSLVRAPFVGILVDGFEG
jgi:uncharacterized delta-60 repeat protein